MLLWWWHSVFDLLLEWTRTIARASCIETGTSCDTATRSALLLHDFFGKNAASSLSRKKKISQVFLHFSKLIFLTSQVLFPGQEHRTRTTRSRSRTTNRSKVTTSSYKNSTVTTRSWSATVTIFEKKTRYFFAKKENIITTRSLQILAKELETKERPEQWQEELQQSSEERRTQVLFLRKWPLGE